MKRIWNTGHDLGVRTLQIGAASASAVPYVRGTLRAIRARNAAMNVSLISSNNA